MQGRSEEETAPPRSDGCDGDDSDARASGKGQAAYVRARGAGAGNGSGGKREYGNGQNRERGVEKVQRTEGTVTRQAQETVRRSGKTDAKE